MKNLFDQIIAAKSKRKKLLAILLDPDKIKLEQVLPTIHKINESIATHIFIGGSSVNNNILNDLIQTIKQNCSLPILLFPGDFTQISAFADGILFLNLLSGRNAEFLVGQHVKAVPYLKSTSLEVIPTAYILIESGSTSAVERVSQTKPMSSTDVTAILNTAIAGELMGNKLVYLEAGSGAKNAVSADIIRFVSNNISVPLIVGGGIRTKSQMAEAYKAGADLVVIGTAFENDLAFFEDKI